jgi:hypothetical protein
LAVENTDLSDLRVRESECERVSSGKLEIVSLEKDEFGCDVCLARVHGVRSGQAIGRRRCPERLNMTPAEVIETCWGKPLRIVKKTTGAGVEENFVCGVGHIVKFSDGKISEIVEAR